MDDHLDESRYDCIVVGTGVTESVLAGALSRIGKKVLHLDAMPFYGGEYATLPIGSDLKDALLSDSWIDVDESRVDKALKIAQGEAADVDAVGRPVVRDGLPSERGPWCRKALAHKVLPKMTSYSNVRFEEKLPAISPPQEEASAPEEADGVDGAQLAQQQAEGGAHDANAADAEPDHPSPARQIEGWDELVAHGRGYNIDLVPKLSLSAGSLVRSLLKSGVGRYLEFMPLQSTFIYLPAKGGGLERVPMSKGEIFQSKGITPIEKRLLMKFMQRCLSMGGLGKASEGSWGVEGVGVSENEQLGFQRAVGHMGPASAGAATVEACETGKTFGDLMKEEKLTETLESFVRHAIAMCSGDCSAEEGAAKVQMYARSLGRYSDTPFLATYYGAAEIPQAFCRLGAVYGATYVLRRAPSYILTDDVTGRCCGVICNRGQRLSAPTVVMSSRYCPPSLCTQESPSSSSEAVHRCVCITDFPLVIGQSIALCVLPPKSCENQGPVRVLQLDHTSQACPRGKFVWHLWCKSGEADLSNALSLLRRMAPSAAVSWCAFYTQPTFLCKQVAPGAWVTSSPSAEVDGGDAIDEAEKLFRSIVGPDAEWLEKMPDPEVVEEEWGGGGAVDLDAPGAGGGGLAGEEDEMGAGGGDVNAGGNSATTGGAGDKDGGGLAPEDGTGNASDA